MVEIKCPHLHKAKTVYNYEIGDGIEISLCECCNMNLAGEIMKQIALESFCPKEEDDEQG